MSLPFTRRKRPRRAVAHSSTQWLASWEVRSPSMDRAIAFWPGFRRTSRRAAKGRRRFGTSGGTSCGIRDAHTWREPPDWARACITRSRTGSRFSLAAWPFESPSSSRPNALPRLAYDCQTSPSEGSPTPEPPARQDYLSAARPDDRGTSTTPWRIGGCGLAKSSPFPSPVPCSPGVPAHSEAVPLHGTSAANPWGENTKLLHHYV